MEFKRCERCGSFFVTNTSTCANCLNKENLDASKLKNYMENNGGKMPSIEALSYDTGITEKNLARLSKQWDGLGNGNF